jgi:hypothetical protein
MTGLKIQFDTSGPILDLENKVSGFAATAQNGLVQIGTINGSDPIFPTRGTDLLLSAVAGSVINIAAARHIANFAALDAKSFLTSYEDPSVTERLEELKLSPVSLDYLSLHLETQFISTDGQVIGLLSTLPTTSNGIA